MTPPLDDVAAIKYVDVVGVADSRKAMADENDRSTLGALLDMSKYLPFGPGIQGARGLVEYKDLRVTHEGSSQGDLLPLAYAQLLTLVKPSAQKGVVAVAQAQYSLVRIGITCGFLDGGILGVQGNISEPDVLSYSEQVLSEVLKHDAQMLTQFDDIETA